MIGQDKLKNKITSFKDLPNSILLCGEQGIGKKTFLNYLINILNINTIDLSSGFSDDIKQELYTSIGLKLVIFNLDVHNNTISLQNSILKLLEEPPFNCKIMLLTSDKSSVLNTIMNRCDIWEFDSYSYEELLSIANSNNVFIEGIEYLDILSTPYNIINYYDVNKLKEIENLSKSIIDNITKANISNILSISNKVNFKDEEDKYCLDILVRAIRHTMKNFLCNTTCRESYIQYLAAYNKIIALDKNIHKFNANKKSLFEKFLLEFRECVI